MRHAVVTRTVVVLALVFAGDATGEVQVEDLASAGPPVTCFASCTVPLVPGASYAITPSTLVARSYSNGPGVCTGLSFGVVALVVRGGRGRRGRGREERRRREFSALFSFWEAAGDL